ncbi:cell division cycle protein 20 homolog B [Leptonychotes weddellii]|uniref:Cell division cycle protein 20 homolog B n=1 Tax=Leptonychotes weddellii TaxID=9713 RepID=A0A2U3XMJ3_LEPWE|nr:cell division cycle protein 20 homolog B [Leptonychotes weddellii]
MEWKLERTARRRVRTEEEMMWENVMRVLAKDLKQKRSPGSPRTFDEVKTTYSSFKSNFVKRLSAEVPIASSPVTTRGRQSQTRDLAACSSGEELSTTYLPEASGSMLKITPEKETLILGSYQEPLKTPIKRSFETSNSALHFCKAAHALDRGWNENVASKGQVFVANTKAVSNDLLLGCRDGVRDESFHLKRVSDRDYSILQPEVKIHLTGLRNDYSIARTQARVFCWKPAPLPLCSGSRLGRVSHHDVRVAQHHVGTLHHKQAVCALKWSPDGRLLSSGCSDGLLTIWPHDPGAKAQVQPLKVIPQPTAVKAMDWCPWQSAVLAVGGGMEDGHLRVLDVNTGQSIQTPSTNSQICSLIWLPKTKEIASGQGSPKNDVTVWACPGLARSRGFLGPRGRVLHLALSPDQTRVFSAAADGTACEWNCCRSAPPRAPVSSLRSENSDSGLVFSMDLL